MRPGIYQHYKGGLYLVLGTAFNANNEAHQDHAPQVVYLPLYDTCGKGKGMADHLGPPQTHLAVRSLDEFTGMANTPSGDSCARFRLMVPFGMFP